MTQWFVLTGLLGLFTFLTAPWIGLPLLAIFFGIGAWMIISPFLRNYD